MTFGLSGTQPVPLPKEKITADLRKLGKRKTGQATVSGESGDTGAEETARQGTLSSR